ncbi:HAMP domain-containing histidine kinase [bacterium]|nr:HAMP domain-containing histidine kinase [bacterium]
MAKNSTSAASFKPIYIGLLLFWISLSLASVLASVHWFVPAIVQSRAQNLNMMVQSHASNIPLHLTRELRDQLAYNDILRSDRELKVIMPTAESEHFSSILAGCTFVNDSVCAGQNSVAILVKGTKNRPHEATALVHLATPFLNLGGMANVFLGLGIGLSGLIFGLLALGTRFREIRLRQEVLELHSIIHGIEKLFDAEDAVPSEEFQHLKDKLNSILNEANGLKSQFSKYQKWLEAHSNSEEGNKILKDYNHDIQSPLDAAEGLLRGLPLYLKELPKDRLNAMIESTLSSLESGKEALSLALKAVPKKKSSGESVQGIIAHLNASLRNSEKLKGLNVSFIYDGSIRSAKIKIPFKELEPIIWNLASNAADANAKIFRLEFEAIEESQIRITAHDDGDGVPEWLQKDIFLEYVSTKDYGHGIGLASVRRRLRAVGGSIELLQSKSGACFELKLPIIRGGINV